MVYNRVRPVSSSDTLPVNAIDESNHSSSVKDFNDSDSISTVHLEESSYLKLKPFSRLDPTLVRLISFLRCFGLFVNLNQPTNQQMTTIANETRRESEKSLRQSGKKNLEKRTSLGISRYLRVFTTLTIAIVTGEVVYDVNLRQSKLLAEQKRSTPLLTFVIVAYSWLTLVIPVICDLSLILIGPHLFRFYSRTTSTVCNGIFFGKKTSVDSWYYYFVLVLIAFLDVVGQVVLLGVWPKCIDPYMRMILFQDTKSIATMANMTSEATNRTAMMATSNTASTIANIERELENESAPANQIESRITTFLLDSLLGEKYAHSDLGICIKIVCLMIQFMHSYAFLMIIISLANHYATVINSINDNLDKYEFRRLLKQLIILRDSSEQISLMISIPFSLIIMLVFMRQIALNGVFIQSTMQPFENWAVSLQSLTCSVSIFMVFIYSDGLQSASKQTHRLKTEQTVINENRGGNQSIYEFLDYLDRLSKSIRITFFNIIAINKSSLVALYGHILTLTFVTS